MSKIKLILLIVTLLFFAGLFVTQNIVLRMELMNVKKVNSKLLSKAACKYWYNITKELKNES
tara:strand:+ start:243 stop:428 length:186 start_codon:yes stop_codon:yes gene_type:complete